ncbi:MAG: DUF2807 domain-containing protein [Bacteroidales bacterium]|nr:DUF2807 domain-containing protein [Bacteroidales bacterium]MCF8344563.1 DUF2807 domain-containing protein [Bacteroidales bacterium]MCF8350342.1 DUF2807 domain-containing protein [Bacteroidales bacterium]MCF8376474.1 DUF2807 domain-containing protein [Bacteroidales bacterium]
MKKTNILLGLITLIMLIAGTSCHDGLNCIEGNHQVVNEYREVPAFTSIVSQGSFDVFLIQDTITEVKVEAESNLMDHIRTNVYGSNLEIDFRKNTCVNTNHPIRVTVRTPFIESAVIEGSGYLGCDYFNTPSLRLHIVGSGSIEMETYCENIETRISGSGNIELWGSSIVADHVISGSGSVRTYNLPVETCYATISGSGNMYVNVSDLLDVVISGSGSVYYMGNPTVITDISGSGSVIHQ